VKAIVTGNIPFTFVDNPHLFEACQSLGLQTISRKQLADKWVPLLAEEALISNAATLARMALVDASSDGCRKKYCEKGAALNNIIALVPDWAYFHDAINCTSMRKDAEALRHSSPTPPMASSTRIWTGWLAGCSTTQRPTAARCVRFKSVSLSGSCAAALRMAWPC
jgi:hypothetical protein